MQPDHQTALFFFLQEEEYLTKLVRLKLTERKNTKIVSCKTRGQPLVLYRVRVARQGKTSSSVKTPTKKVRSKILRDITTVIAGPREEDAVEQTAVNLKTLSEEKRAAVLKYAACHQVSISAKTATQMRAKLLLSWAKQRTFRKFAKDEQIKFPSERQERKFQKKAMMGEVGVKEVAVYFFNKRQDRQTIQKTPMAHVENLTTFVTNLLDSYEEKEELIWPGSIPKDEIWLKIGGDHGGGSFKLALQLANIKNPNSSMSTHLIQLLECKDSVHNLQRVLCPMNEQIKALESLTWKNKRIRVILCGDYDFELKMFGISGAQSSFPCLWCQASREEIQMQPIDRERLNIPSRSLASLRRDNKNFVKAGCHKEQAKQYHNVTTQPIWDINLDNVTPPYLHILLGIVKKHHDLLEDRCHNLDKQLALAIAREGGILNKDALTSINPDFKRAVKKVQTLIGQHKTRWLEKLKTVTVFEKQSGPITANLEKILAKHRIVPQAFHSGAFIGNHCNKYLDTDVFVELMDSIVVEAYRLTDDHEVHNLAQDTRDTFVVLNDLFSRVHRLISHSKPIAHSQLPEIETAISEYMMFFRMRFGHTTRVIPKQHILEAHCVSWIKKTGFGMALLGEQGCEQLHATVNQLKRRAWGLKRKADSLVTQMTESLIRTSPVLLDTPKKDKTPANKKNRK